jgi:hypothetical protein
MGLKVNRKHGLLRHRRLARGAGATYADGALQRSAKQLTDGGALGDLLAAARCGRLVAGPNDLRDRRGQAQEGTSTWG